MKKFKESFYAKKLTNLLPETDLTISSAKLER